MSPELDPAVFIVGVPRSGTTMLRLMIDSHPLVAIPPETGFVASIARRCVDRPDRPMMVSEFIDFVSQYPPDAPAWPDFSLPIDELRRGCELLPTFTVQDGLRCFYRLYASQHGKPMWGDKTPTYGPHLDAIRLLLPEARFIHVIRDGRDVACSLRPMWFAPSREVGELAAYWRDLIIATRRAAVDLTGYVEVRFESLITNPEAELRRVVETVGIPFHPDMLAYFLRSPARLAEHRARIRLDGSVVVSREQRLHQQHLTTHPPDSARIGAWRNELTSEELATFTYEAGDLLSELGYGR